MLKRYQWENLYRTIVNTKMNAIGSSWDPMEEFSIEVAQAPKNTAGWVIVDFTDSTKRDLIFFHNRTGTTLKYYRKNRDLMGIWAANATHLKNAPIQINDVAERMNYLFANTDDFGMVLNMGTNKIQVLWGQIFKWWVNINVSDTIITLADWNRYAVFDGADNTFKCVAAAVSGQAVLGSITLLSWGITNISDLRWGMYMHANKDVLDWLSDIWGNLVYQWHPLGWGTGTGDVVWPSSSVVGRIVIMNAITWKVIADSWVSISTDWTFASNSDAKVPTEKAAKTYVDTSLNNLDMWGNVASGILWENGSINEFVYNELQPFTKTTPQVTTLQSTWNSQTSTTWEVTTLITIKKAIYITTLTKYNHYNNQPTRARIKNLAWAYLYDWVFVDNKAYFASPILLQPWQYYLVADANGASWNYYYNWTGVSINNTYISTTAAIYTYQSIEFIPFVDYLDNTDWFQNIWDTSVNKRISWWAYATSLIWWNKFITSLWRKWTPWSDLKFRIETDGGSNGASWTLIDASADVAIPASGLPNSTPVTDNTTWYSWTHYGGRNWRGSCWTFIAKYAMDNIIVNFEGQMWWADAVRIMKDWVELQQIAWWGTFTLTLQPWLYEVQLHTAWNYNGYRWSSTDLDGTNVKLLTNSWYYYWYRKGITSSLVPSPYLITVNPDQQTNSHGVTLDNTTTNVNEYKWVSVTLTYGINILTVTKNASCTASKCYLYDTSGNLLTRATFSSNIATLNYFSLTNGVTYYVLTGSDGAAYTSVKQTWSATYPYVSNRLNYVAGVNLLKPTYYFKFDWNSNDETWNMTWTPTEYNTPTYTSWVYWSALTLNGTNQYVQFNQSRAITGKFSFSVRLYRTAAWTWNNGVIEFGWYDQNTWFGLWLDSSNRLSWTINQTYNNYASINYTLPLNTRTTIGVVYNWATVSFYVNGVLYWTPIVHTNNPNNFVTCTFGKRYWNSESYGWKIDSLVVFDWALSAEYMNFLANNQYNSFTDSNIHNITSISSSGKLTGTEWQKVRMVFHDWTYGSEWVDASNYYRIWYNTQNTTTRFMQKYDWSSYTLLNNYFMYCMSAMFRDYIISKTNAAYLQKVDDIWVLKETKTYWNICKFVVGWAKSWFSNLSIGELYYLTDTYWWMWLTAWTNKKCIWRAISANTLLLDVKKQFGSYTSITANTVYTARQSGFVFWYGVNWATWYADFINGSTTKIAEQSMNTYWWGSWNCSIFFPVIKWQKFSMTVGWFFMWI